MTTLEITKETEIYINAFDELEKNGALSFADVRKTALEHFTSIGFPSHRRDENWRNTNLQPMLENEFALAGEADLDEADHKALEKILFKFEDIIRVVFVNGIFSTKLSNIEKLPAGAVITNLQTAISENPELIENYFGKFLKYENQAFAALNTAFMSDGLVAYIPDNTKMDSPIQIVHYSKSNGSPTVSYPRHLIVAGKNSQFGIVESYTGKDGDVYLTNTGTEIILDENAIVDHLKIQEEPESAFHMANVQIDQEQSSQLLQTAVTIGGKIARNDIGTVMNDEGCHCQLNGLYMPHHDQHVDTHTRMDHAKPNCTSEEIYKGILDDKASGVFNGKIDVRQDAQKTDAVQSNHALLLSKEAKINTRPQLEIYADDVKCTHGATVGEVDENAIYYLQTRGIDKKKAKLMVIAAFAYEIVEDIKYDDIRQKIHDIVEDRFLPENE